MPLFGDVVTFGIRADQPLATDVSPGTLYSVTDESFLIEQSDGSAWNQYGPTGGGGASTVTAAGTLTSGEPVLGAGAKAVAVGPLNVGGGASFVTGVLPVANGGSGSASGAGILIQATTLNDAQIKALPTTPFQIVAAPSAGTWIHPIAVTYSADCAAAAYTNINTTYADFNLKLGTDSLVYGPVNDSSTSPALAQMTALLGAAAHIVVAVPVPGVAGVGSSPSYVQNIAPSGSGTLSGVALMLAMDNNGSGVLTGGDAANTLKVTVYYAVENL